MRSVQRWGFHQFPEEMLQYLTVLGARCSPLVSSWTLASSDLYPLGIISPPDSWLRGSPLAATLEVLGPGAEVSSHAGHTLFPCLPLCQASQALGQPLWCPAPACAGSFCVLFVQQGPKLATVLWLWPSRHWECGILGRFWSYFPAFFKNSGTL